MPARLASTSPPFDTGGKRCFDHATLSATSTNRFGAVVRQKLLDNKLEGRKPDSIRSLARTLGAGDAVRSETFKRSLFKWMADGDPRPSRESRAIVGRALGLDPSELSDDDEESRAMSLDDFLRMHVRGLVRDELRAAQA